MFVPLTLGWILCWLIPGLWLGNVFALLDGSAPENWKAVYVACLYAVIIGSVTWAWKKCGPCLGTDMFRISHVLLGFAFASVLSCLHWLMIAYGGFCSGAFRWHEVPGLAVTAFLLAAAEEVLFRGYLFGVVSEEKGPVFSAVSVSLFFAVLHVLRPGSLSFKLAYGAGLFIFGLILCYTVQASRGLGLAAGLHSALIVYLSAFPAKSVEAGLFSGLGGEPAAGLFGWVIIACLAFSVPLARRCGCFR